MGSRQKTALTVFVLSLCLVAPESFAKKHKVSDTEVVEEPAVVLQEASVPDAEDLSDLDNALRGQIKDRDFEQSEKLRRARLLLEDGRANEALSLLKDLESGLLVEYARYYESVAYKKLGDHKKALSLLPLGLSLSKRLDWDVLWHKMDLYALDKQVSTLRQLVQQVQRSYSKDLMVRVKSAYFLGKGLLMAGQKSEALQQFLKVLVQDPGTEYDERIFAILKKFGMSQSQVLTEALLNQRAVKLIATGYAHVGRQIFEGLSKKSPSSYRERVAYATFRERRYPEAAHLYAELVKAGGAADRLSLLIYLSQAYARHDNFQGALEINQQIIRDYPRTSAAANSQFKLGFLYFDSGNYQKASEYFSRYIKGGTPKQRESARWYRFWSYYFLKNYPQALNEAKTMMASARNKTVMLTYWMGRIYDEMGKHGEAKSYYKKVANMNGTAYYGLLAKQRLEYGKLDPHFVVSESLLDYVPQGRSSGTGSPNLARVGLNDGLVRAMLLYRAGLDSYAYSENQSVVQNSHSGLSRDSVLALQLGGNYYYSYAVKDSAMGGRVSGCDLLCGYQIAYPQAYKKYVEPFAKHWGLDSKLAYAIMRQESVFKPEALSYAYAYGLMQIIPPTGEEIAGHINYPDFHTYLLNQPKINTLFGTYYLSYLLSKLGNEPVFAIAAYNAGPDAVERWANKYKSFERDVFVELIPYEQTNDYVKKVLVNYLTYRKLYP